jgi:hypothetical protein
LVGGLVLLVAVFWFAFARAPGRRSDGGLTQRDSSNYWWAYNGGAGLQWRRLRRQSFNLTHRRSRVPKELIRHPRLCRTLDISSNLSSMRRRLRDDTALPPHEQLNRSVPFAKLSAEQVATMSAAIKTVLYHRDGEDDRKLRALVTRVVLAIANLGDFDKETLTILAIEKLGEPARKSA